MAARATRSASRKARAATEALTTRGADAVATGPLGALSHDELGVIFDGLANPLQPVVAIAFGSTCLGLQIPLRADLEVLKEQHEGAVALCRKLGTTEDYPHHARGSSCEQVRGSVELYSIQECLNAGDVATLGLILCKLPKLQIFDFIATTVDSACVNSFCECLRRVWLPCLTTLSFTRCRLGPAVAEALAAAVSRGALPRIEELTVGGNSFGREGGATLAASLRKLRALRVLQLWGCSLGDEGVVSLFANLGKDDFKALKGLHISGNLASDVACAAIVASLNTDAMPALRDLHCFGALANDADIARQSRVDDAFKQATERRGAA